jgi:hypothetical protein
VINPFQVDQVARNAGAEHMRPRIMRSCRPASFDQTLARPESPGDELRQRRIKGNNALVEIVPARASGQIIRRERSKIRMA